MRAAERIEPPVFAPCSCFHWRRLAAALREVFPHLTGAEVSYELRHFKKNIGLCLCGGEIAGFFVYGGGQTREVAWLNYFGVRSGFRNRGIGGILMRKLEEGAAARGFRRIELAVKRDNLTAIKFYERWGYSRLKEEPQNFTYYKEIVSAGAPALERRPGADLPEAFRKAYWRIVYWFLVEVV